MTSSTSLHAQRRARLAAQLGSDGIALVPTAPERPRNRDSDFPYRHDSYFFYLTGFSEPNAWLAITGDGRSTLLSLTADGERTTALMRRRLGEELDRRMSGWPDGLASAFVDGFERFVDGR